MIVSFDVKDISMCTEPSSRSSSGKGKFIVKEPAVLLAFRKGTLESQISQTWDIRTNFNPILGAPVRFWRGSPTPLPVASTTVEDWCFHRVLGSSSTKASQDSDTPQLALSEQEESELSSTIEMKRNEMDDSEKEKMKNGQSHHIVHAFAALLNTRPGGKKKFVAAGSIAREASSCRALPMSLVSNMVLIH